MNMIVVRSLTRKEWLLFDHCSSKSAVCSKQEFDYVIYETPRGEVGSELSRIKS